MRAHPRSARRSGKQIRRRSPHVVMMNRLPVKLEGTAPLLPAACQVEAAGLPVVTPTPRIDRGIHRAGGYVATAVHVSVVVRVVAIVRDTEADLAGAVAVRMLRARDRWARMRVRVAEAVAVRRRRQMT